jgi:hypothetical protein
MIGQPHFIGEKTYIEVNDHGTLEIMPKISWFWQLILYFKYTFQGFNNPPDVKNYCRRHQKTDFRSRVMGRKR